VPLTPPKELTEKAPLVDAKGALNSAARGWSKRQLLDTTLPGPFLRRKRWDFVCVSHPEFLFGAAISNADYAGLCFAWMLELPSGRFFDRERLAPLALGITLPDRLSEASISNHRGLGFSLTPRGPSLDLVVTSDRFGADPLELRLQIEQVDESEGLHLVVPWDHTHFNYTAKLCALPGHGELVAGGRTYTLTTQNTSVSLDRTRGIWPYKTAWRWASGTGFVDGRRFGLNFGAGWTDGTGVVENALYLDGKVLPLWEPVRFTFNPNNRREPWSFATIESARVRLQFHPLHDRAQRTALGIVDMQLTQVLGHYSGQVILEGGQALRIDKLPGVVEDHKARW
jgi:hypothetical protein